MKSRKPLTPSGSGGFIPTSKHRCGGFSIIEILVVVGLFSVLVSLGLIMSMDVWRGSSLTSEHDIIVGLLHRARSRAVSNVNESSHGVFIDESNEQYILFEGSSYSGATQELPFDMGKDFVFSGDTEIVFDAREGTTNGYSFTIEGRGRSRMFTINEEGGVTWEQV